MGCFGYICKGCGTAIIGDCHNGGENCVLIHVRSGKEVGRATGHYGEYGNVVEDKLFRCSDDTEENETNINSHDEICESEMQMKDSFHFYGRRMYEGKALDFEQVCWKVKAKAKKPMRDMMAQASLDKINGKITEDECRAIFDEAITKETEIDYDWNMGKKEWDALEVIKDFPYSGIVAWHHKCYNKASDEQKADLTPSFPDPNQSWGKVRKKYM